MNQSIEENFDKNFDKEILINIDLNKNEERINELIQNVEYEEIKQSSYNICKNCLYKYCDFDNSLCESCENIQFTSRISTTFLFTGILSGSIISGIIFSLSNASCISIGLCSGNILKCIYDMVSYGFADIKPKRLKNLLQCN